MSEIDIKQRLLTNLDQLDKSIARTALAMFVLAVLYLALYYNIASEIKLPLLHDLAISRRHAFLWGIPVIFCLFQFSFVTTVGIIHVERELDKSTAGDAFSPMIHSLRFPTLFALVFLLAAQSRTAIPKTLLMGYAFLVFAFYYGSALVAGAHILRWLVEDGASWCMISLSGTLLLVCAGETVISLRVSILRLIACNSSATCNESGT